MYNKFRFTGYLVTDNGNIESSTTFSFSFKNIGTNSVEINGILLAPQEEFNEPLLSNEMSYGNYTCRFIIGGGTNILRVIEKFLVK